ncbi:MAG TPA: hypothetical protein VK548_23875 [Candidatus Acidoferrum sp.]|nr:hypothetical protein [Candidatus Acidoferrum sp.]
MWTKLGERDLEKTRLLALAVVASLTLCSLDAAAGDSRPERHSDSSFATICFKDERNITYGVTIAVVLGQTALVLITRVPPMSALIQRPTPEFLVGGAYLRGDGKASVNASGPGSGIALLLDPPNFNSGGGNEFLPATGGFPGAISSMTFTPAPCLDPLP